MFLGSVKLIVKGYKCLFLLKDKGSNWEIYFCHCIDFYFVEIKFSFLSFSISELSIFLFLYFVSVYFSS
jgi:hypothetical protein